MPCSSSPYYIGNFIVISQFCEPSLNFNLSILHASPDIHVRTSNCKFFKWFNSTEMSNTHGILFQPRWHSRGNEKVEFTVRPAIVINNFLWIIKILVINFLQHICRTTYWLSLYVLGIWNGILFRWT